jgi:hypothetical protein
MLWENDLATLAREITSRHGIDRRSLLPLAPRRDAVGEARFLKRDADLHLIGRRGGKELQPINTAPANA